MPAAGKSELFVEAELFVELIDTPAGIDELLLAGKVRVALRAYLNADVLFGGAGFNDLAASTPDGCLLIIGMDALFHHVHLFR